MEFQERTRNKIYGVKLFLDPKEKTNQLGKTPKVLS